MPVSETLPSYSTTASSNTPAGSASVGPDLDDHLRDIKKNIATMAYDGHIWCGTAGGTANAITLTPAPTITAYAAGQEFVFKAGSSANTGAVTFAISGLATIAGQVNGAACVGNEILADKWYSIRLSDTSTAQITPLAPAQVIPYIPGGRITLTTAVPVTTSAVTGATTVYYTPYKHDRIGLYDGSEWVNTKFTELSQATSDNTKSPAAVANNSNYDLFVWSDSGTLRCTRGPAWSSNTARGTGAGTTELELFEGRYVNKVAVTNGPAARRGVYVGSIRSDGSAQINDSLTKRHVWNAYNQEIRHMLATDATASWTYTLDTPQQANANAANQLDYIQGLSDSPVQADVLGIFQSSTAVATIIAKPGIGVDSTSAGSETRRGWQSNVGGSAWQNVTASYRGFPGIGRHYLAWLEQSTASGTTTWTGTGAAGTSGISGAITG